MDKRVAYLLKARKRGKIKENISLYSQIISADKNYHFERLILEKGGGILC